MQPTMSEHRRGKYHVPQLAPSSSGVFHPCLNHYRLLVSLWKGLPDSSPALLYQYSSWNHGTRRESQVTTSNLKFPRSHHFWPFALLCLASHAFSSEHCERLSAFSSARAPSVAAPRGLLVFEHFYRSSASNTLPQASKSAPCKQNLINCKMPFIYKSLASSLPQEDSLSVVMATLQMNLVSQCLLNQRIMEVVVTAGAIGRARLQSNHYHQQTNTKSFLQAGCPSWCTTNSVKALKVKYHIIWTCLPQTHLAVFQLCLCGH